MQTGFKAMLALLVIGLLFIYFPQILAFGFNLGGSGGGNGTLSQRTVGQQGIISVSADGGETFKEANIHGVSSPMIFKIESAGSNGLAGSLYYAATNRGLLISKDNGLNWHSFSDLEKNIDGKTALYDFAFYPSGNAVFVSASKNGHGVVYATADDFFTVTPIWSEANMRVSALAADQSFLYLAVSDGRLLRYRPIQKQFEKVKQFDAGIEGFNLANGGKNLFVTLNNGAIYASFDYGSSWQGIQNNAAFAYFSPRSFDLTVDRGNRSVLYLASAAGIFRSINQGANWIELPTILPSRINLGAIAVDDGAIFVAHGSKLYKSMDGGFSWRIKEPLPTNRKLTALYLSNGGQTVIVGTGE